MKADYPIEAVRAQFPALTHADEAGRLPILFDAPGGSQVPRSVTEAVCRYLGLSNSNLGGYAAAGRETQAVNSAARQMAALWLGAQAEEIVFGLNSTGLMFQISRAVAKTWQRGDNIIVSAIDHYSHVSSWQSAAEDCGVEVRTLPLRADGADLDYGRLNDLADGRTRLMAYSLASNVLGTLTDSTPFRQTAARTGALISIDAVHAAVHRLIDVRDLDCDFLFASAYKLGGPHLGMMFAKAGHLRRLTPYKVEPATEAVPQRWEQGTQSFEAQAGFIALMDYWQNLAQFADGADSDGLPRRRLRAAYGRVQAYEAHLSSLILQHIRARPFIRLYGKDTAAGRTPTFAFNIETPSGILPPQAVSRWFGERNVAVGSGNFYALGVVRHFGIGQQGLLRMGCLHYHTEEEIGRFFALLDECVAEMAQETR
ncbi:cysteine desulfurase-like protein [Neisseria leonii]|uniref:Cysteine desulfurase-like protein n=1 Tax=Neisseria leonii TaxID=2995413 RepID=A0A9X4E100_9NEIS|nr:cysteine desulfurase-like protein [Neisseria sp. 51.81]MDD9327441.1 cysteine desulfurase-like protein [Neisseria sp. 51.81]